ncbi:hypothetical protein WI97_08335 [Burkholderia vietnamiensis]|nr:hypothetical protein WI97_08335 [Burkholderia vietnamiensis]
MHAERRKRGALTERPLKIVTNLRVLLLLGENLSICNFLLNTRFSEANLICCWLLRSYVEPCDLTGRERVKGNGSLAIYAGEG